MKKLSYMTIATLGLLLICAGTVWADIVDPATLQIGNPPNAGDPNLISGGSFVVHQNQGGAGTIANLVLLFSVPNPPGGSITVLTSSAGSIGSVSFAGTLMSTGCSDVYSCAGISGMNNSNNFPNLSGAELAKNGITATSFSIFRVTITGANLGAGGNITITGAFPQGTFVDAFGIDNTGTPFGTPFTEAGLTTGQPIPEPGTLALFGSGLIGIATLIRRRLAA
jgi:hypothetical protein